MPVEGRVEVRGLKELQRALRQVDAEIPKRLRTAFRPIAEHVVAGIRSKVPSSSGEAAGQVRARAGQRGAGVAFPGGGAPWRGVKGDYFPWLDFGGSTGHGHRPRVAGSGATKRARVEGGRYVYPTIEEQGPYIVEAAGKAVEDVARGAEFEVRG